MKKTKLKTGQLTVIPPKKGRRKSVSEPHPIEEAIGAISHAIDVGTRAYEAGTRIVHEVKKAGIRVVNAAKRLGRK